MKLINILLVEDEIGTREGVEEFLKVKGYNVTAVSDGEVAIEVFKDIVFDMVILDIMLPKLDGFSVLNVIRDTSETPVLMLTAMDDERTQLMSFDHQADDYMSKPFSLHVLERRIEALLRRKEVNYQEHMWLNKDVKIDFSSYQAIYRGEQVDLKPKEFQVLSALVKHKNKVLSRDQILDQVWGYDETPMDRVVDVYIKNLRKKLNLEQIKTVKGVGYKYEA